MLGGFGLSVAYADDAEDTFPLGTDIGVIDQIVSSSFEPASLLVLQETALGEVHQYRASAVLIPSEDSNDKSSSSVRRIVGAPVPLESDDDDDFFHFTFFMASEDSGFAATETKRWSQNELLRNSPSYAELAKQMAEIRHRLKIKRVAAIDLGEQLEELKQQASEIAGVDQIVKLKMQLASLRGVDAEKDDEIKRLQALGELGRSISDPPEVDDLRAEIAEHLREAAKITSMADRLNQRKKDAARQRFLAKIRAVKEMQSVDPEALAQQILELRKTRRDFETRLGLRADDNVLDDF
jgi:hypothetical protein